MSKLDEVAAALERRGFETKVCASGAEAADVVAREMEGVESVGFGGSMTTAALGLHERAAALGKTVLRHGDKSLTPQQREDVMRAELTCDLFLLSANALTADGVIVNIDGNGNRVAASIFGPKRVIYVVGRNKIVDGGVEAAIARIKRESCPPNCRRLGKQTPCAATGECADCSSPDRICNVTTIFDRRPRRTPTRVVLVDEDLGF
ncbi:MAG: lactate utilization protein [Kiritimatiellae bacterium]|nr:lactate utilization protein [Kiritimatiellia bacterium]